MTLNIDFTPPEAAWLDAQAQQQGLPPAEIIRKMVDAHLHAAQTDHSAGEQSQSGRAALYEEFRQAASDPLFMQDVAETEAAFASADAQTARMLPDD